MAASALPMLSDPRLWIVALAALLAATVRGFAGFGAAMIFVPVAAAMLGPRNAASILLVVDSLMIAPYVVGALRLVEWAEVLPLGIAGLVAVPLGAAALAYVDPVPVRWGISAVILGFVVLLAAGLRYRGPTRLWLSTLVGLTSGFLSGVAQMSGPPVVLYWLGRRSVPRSMRANVIVFFCFTGCAAAVSYAASGIFTRQVFTYSLLLVPFYALGLFAGSRMFGFASEATYRRVAYVVILVVAVASMPIFG